MRLSRGRAEVIQTERPELETLRAELLTDANVRIGAAVLRDYEAARTETETEAPVVASEPATSNGALTGVKGRILDLLLRPTGATEPEVCTELGWKQAGATISRTIKAAVATGRYAVDKTKDGRSTRYVARRLA